MFIDVYDPDDQEREEFEDFYLEEEDPYEDIEEDVDGDFKNDSGANAFILMEKRIAGKQSLFVTCGLLR